MFTSPFDKLGNVCRSLQATCIGATKAKLLRDEPKLACFRQLADGFLKHIGEVMWFITCGNSCDGFVGHESRQWNYECNADGEIICDLSQ